MPETSPQTEVINVYTGVRFEPGIHPITAQENNAMYQGFNEGNLHTHLWNPQVAQRMKTYNPAVIAIDGSVSDRFIIEGDADNYQGFTSYIKDSPAWNWLSIPDRPNQLNKEGKIYVVHGDISYTDLAGIFWTMGSNYQDLQNDIQRMQKLEEKERTETNNYFSKMDTQTHLFESFLGGVVAGLVVATLNVRKLSRRNFLKTATAASAAVLAGVGPQVAFPRPSDLPHHASLSKNEQAKELMQRVITALRPRFTEELWLNGRTAIVMAKEEDAIDALGLPKDTPGAVVMGDGHSPQANVLLEDKVERAKTIDEFAKYLFDLSDTIYAEIFGKGTDMYYYYRNPGLNYLLTLLGKVQISKVTDPGGSDNNPNLKNDVNDYVEVVKTFQSPQIEKIIGHLRIPMTQGADQKTS